MAVDTNKISISRSIQHIEDGKQLLESGQVNVEDATSHSSYYSGDVSLKDFMEATSNHISGKAGEIEITFNASSDESSDTINAGDLVIDTEFYTLDGISYFGVVKDAGHTDVVVRIPRGLMKSSLAANARGQNNLIIIGGTTITVSSFIGKQISQGDPLFITLSGSGASRKWVFTEEVGADNIHIGHFIQAVNTLTGEYEVYVNFDLAHVPAIIDRTIGLSNYKNDAGSEQFAGYGAVFSYESGNDQPVAIIPPIGQLPEAFYLTDTANQANGHFARSRVFEKVEVHGNGSIAHLQLLTQGDKIYYIPGLSKPEFTTTVTSHKEAGFVLSSTYKLPLTTYFDSGTYYGGFNSVNISTGSEVNAHKNKTYILPNKGSATTLTFAESNPVGASEQNTAWDVGDRFTIINRAGSNVTFRLTVGNGTVNFRSLSGSNITQREISPSSINDQSLTIEVQSDRVWKVVAINEGVLSSNVFISLDKMNNLRLDALEVQSEDVTELNSYALKGYFEGGNTTWVSNSSMTISPFTARSDDNSTMIDSNSTRTLGVSSVGDNGLDTGSVANSTWYYIWALKNPTSDAVQVRLSTSNSSPTLPSGFTKKRFIGVARTDSSGNFRKFFEVGEDQHKTIVWDAEATVVNNGQSQTRTNIDCTSQVPNLPQGYPLIKCIFETQKDLKIYMADSTAQHAYINTTNGDYETAEISDIVLSSSGGFGYEAAEGSANIHIKVLSFKLDL